MSTFLEQWKDERDYIVAHTSGSTGIPKEIKLLKADMRRSAEATCRFFGISDKSRLVLPLSTDYIAGKMIVVRSIVSGAELIIEKPSSIPLDSDYGTVDLTAVVPSQVEGLLKSPSKIKTVIVGGGQLSDEQEQMLANSPIHAFATYGMTETCSHVALRDISSRKAYFTAVDGFRFSSDARGCLVIDAPQFSFKQVVTNDVVDLLDDKRFKWVGRVDNVINSGGVKLHPELIERMLAPYIPYPFYIVGRPSSRWGQEAVMYVESDKADGHAIIEKARSILDRYSVPKEVICVKMFSRTESGKIKRLLL